MTKSRNDDQVGDAKTPSLQPSIVGLRVGAGNERKIAIETNQSAVKPSLIQSASYTSHAASEKEIPPKTCKQILWFSFFFDGTGNNRYVDENFQKLSNVAKLFRVHKPTDQNEGIYSIYIQGVGTYFPEVGDDGGSMLGLGCGKFGTERLNYALKIFDEAIKYHLQRAKSPSNAIVEINISAFGFSRGAALARAFVNLLLDERCILAEQKWVLKNGFWPVRIRFMGLFDTVASVGVPMSSNTTGKIAAAISSLSYMIQTRLDSYSETRPVELAFSKNAVAGADPAPGKYNGHVDWGDTLQINEKVEEVRHFIAAHEMRNSFPVESISFLKSNVISKPPNFYESVYPGVHSDVGGSYAPGEGSRAETPSENLGLIPLLHMYNFALRKGVPLRSVGNWFSFNKEDFNINEKLVMAYNSYCKAAGSASTLGQAINNHMALYFAWRFRAIRRKLAGDKKESAQIESKSKEFREEGAEIDRELDVLNKEKEAAEKRLKSLLENFAASVSARVSEPARTSTQNSADRLNIEKARQKVIQSKNNILKAKARKQSLPNMESLQKQLNFYDAQLLLDVRSIKNVLSLEDTFRSNTSLARRQLLRPHYKILIDAYENEFEKNKGLKDEDVIKFFDRYVHDSLAAFAKDATLPSDPRVVYLGGDVKYEYAQKNNDGFDEKSDFGVA